MIPEDELERWEAIEKYLDGKMTEEEKINFIQAMEKNKVWQEELETARKMHTALDDYFVEQRMRNTIQQLQSQDKASVPARPATYFRTLVLYGSLVAAACILLYLSFAPISLPDAGYDINIMRSADSTVLSAQQRMAFEHFFEGQAHMAEGQYVWAVKNFEQVLQHQDLRPYFREAAQWHLAISYLRSNQPHRAGKLYAQLNNCDACEYHVNWLNRLKMQWQITWQKWVS